MAERVKIALRKAKCLVAGGSAGAFEQMYELVSMLPNDFPMPVIVVLHRGKDFRSNLKQLFQSRSQVKIKEADEKEALEPGVVYLAPVNFHLLVEPDHTISMDASEPVLFCRPAIDVTFASAADVYGKDLAVMLFSGANADGAEGAVHVLKHGGQVLIQDPEIAEVRSMPEAAAARIEQPVLFSRNDFQQIIDELSRGRSGIKKE